MKIQLIRLRAFSVLNGSVSFTRSFARVIFWLLQANFRSEKTVFVLVPRQVCTFEESLAGRTQFKIEGGTTVERVPLGKKRNNKANKH